MHKIANVKNRVLVILLCCCLLLTLLPASALAGGGGIAELSIIIRDSQTPVRFTLSPQDLAGDFVFTNSRGDTVTISPLMLSASDTALRGLFAFVAEAPDQGDLLVKSAGTYTLTQYPTLPQGYSFVTTGETPSFSLSDLNPYQGILDIILLVNDEPASDTAPAPAASSDGIYELRFTYRSATTAGNGGVIEGDLVTLKQGDLEGNFVFEKGGYDASGVFVTETGGFAISNYTYDGTTVYFKGNAADIASIRSGDYKLASFPLPPGYKKYNSVHSINIGTYNLENNHIDYDVEILVQQDASAPVKPQTPAAADTALTAKPTASTVLVNGENVAFDAYNIGGNNYFKLRDLAYTLNGTDKQFNVAFNSDANAIELIPHEAYQAAGGEMTGKGAGDKTATPTTSTVYLITGENEAIPMNLTAYNIDGNNYFKLRDIGEAFDFGVAWDGAQNTIVIDTSKGYTVD